MASTESEASSGFSGTESVDRTGNSTEFVVACGAKLPVRLTIRNERNGATDEVLLERPWAIVGGDERCDVRLPHPDVSQRHAYLQFVGSRLLCCDLGSRTGTHWTTDIRSRGWLKPEEPIYIGPYSIRVHDNEFADGLAAEEPPSKLDLPRVTLSFVNARSRAGRSKKTRVRRPVTLIGWSHLCNVRLQHSSVGRVHAGLVWAPTGLWIVDLSSRSGTRVNGTPVESARLLEGDEITLGRFQLRVSYADQKENEVEPVSGDSLTGRALLVPQAEAPRANGLTVNGNGNGHAAVGSLAPKAPVLPGPVPSPIELLRHANGIAALKAAGPALPQAGSLTDSVALTLMQQFSAMQQQLFDHTQQLLGVMAQTFSAAHTRQLDLIRSELMRVHEVNRELQELNLELTLSRGSEPAGAASAQPVPANPPVSNGAQAATKDTVPEQPLFDGTTGSNGASEQSEASQSPPRRGKRGKAGGPHGDQRAVPAATAPENRTGEEKTGESQAGEEKAGVDMHAWLSGRINELEQERTSRWQKIIQLLAPSAGQS